ncbi:MAG: DUF2726 domain-containing protein [Oscillospiraceae bacterium]|jgi:hypothetical protein|nr:DUF2726 domain-containing protein [Oscillospiraceae bacterium]
MIIGSIVIIIIVLVVVAFSHKNTNRHPEEHDPQIQQYPPSSYSEELKQPPQSFNTELAQTEYLRTAYSQKWMFTQNEKRAYYQLNKIAVKHGLILFAKVRLFDLVTPRKNHPKYKTNLYKIQAKHVDFVLTKSNLVAKYIIELDDSSHDTPERKSRDNFVDAVLQLCGYKVLHVRDINEDEIEKFLSLS